MNGHQLLLCILSKPLITLMIFRSIIFYLFLKKNIQTTTETSCQPLLSRLLYTNSVLHGLCLVINGPNHLGLWSLRTADQAPGRACTG